MRVAAKPTRLVTMLKAVPLLEGLTRKELQQILGAGKERTHAAGKAVVEQGTSGVGFHLILGGEAEVRINGRKRATMRKGDYFGEISLIDGGPRAATVLAVTDLETFSLASWTFLPIVTKNPAMARKMIDAV